MNEDACPSCGAMNKSFRRCLSCKRMNCHLGVMVGITTCGNPSPCKNKWHESADEKGTVTGRLPKQHFGILYGVSSNELVEGVSNLQGDAFDYSQAEARILSILGPEYVALVRGIAQKSNPLLTDNVRRAVRKVINEAYSGPYPIVDLLLTAIWEALKENDRTL